ncbi:hypothetical protein CDAR_474921 [Caerostris darwini]|uniref:Autophagy-related protein 9 n=1 Tax=Caerostris darwini TaxID=1538125 RepID=A0AAV4QQQ7_9ARAC|nr:hypothetical protein CDAR_474921 [Caerostris darwini]
MLRKALGYICILVEQILRIGLFAFIGFSFLYGTNCIYFNFDQPPSPFSNSSNTLTSFSELFIPVSQCVKNEFGIAMWSLVIIFSTVLIYKLYQLIDKAWKYKDIQQFYENVMKIQKYGLPNITWHEIVARLREVQHEQQICVNNTDLNELDISHRILRTTNYMVAMINKDILPLKQNWWFIGEWIYFPTQLKRILMFLLFDNYFLSPFKAPGKLKEEYKKREERIRCAEELSRTIKIVGIMFLCLAPIVFCWSILSFFVNYSGYLKLEPTFFNTRRWTGYAKLHLRHFNELDHELDKRLSRASKPANEYMRAFSSPLTVVIINFLHRVLGFIVAFIAVWGIIKEPIFTLPYVLVVISVGGIAFSVMSTCVPDENEVLCPNELMEKIVAHIHYIPSHFITSSHTTRVRDEFANLFSCNYAIVLGELLSPLLTPIVLLWYIQPRTLEIVDFLRNFTVHVDGVGDVCSFALMDVSKHGNPQWLDQGLTKANMQQQAEDGKTELSVLHFALMNPNWQPPASSSVFIQNFREQVASAAKDEHSGVQSLAYCNSLHSVATLGSKYASLVNSIDQSMHQSYPRSSNSLQSSSLRREKVITSGMNHAEGPPYHAQNGIWTSVTEVENINPIEARAADMSLSALFLHELHDKQMGSLTSPDQSRCEQQQGVETGEESPLLELRMGENNYVQ